MGLLGSLGITAGWLNNASDDKETLDVDDLGEWQDTYLPAFGKLRENPEASFAVRLKALEGWAARAIDIDYGGEFKAVHFRLLDCWATHGDWGDKDSQKVLKALAQDLGSSPYWKLVLSRIRKLLAERGVKSINFRKLRSLDARGAPVYGLGARCVSTKIADRIFKKINRWRRKANLGRDQFDFPKWTICWSRQMSERHKATALSQDKEDF